MADYFDSRNYTHVDGGPPPLIEFNSSRVQAYTLIIVSMLPPSVFFVVSAAVKPIVSFFFGLSHSEFVQIQGCDEECIEIVICFYCLCIAAMVLGDKVVSGSVFLNAYKFTYNSEASWYIVLFI